MTDIINTILYIWNIWYMVIDCRRTAERDSWFPDIQKEGLMLQRCINAISLLAWNTVGSNPFWMIICTFSNLYSRLGLEHPKSHYIQISLSKVPICRLISDGFLKHSCMHVRPYKLYLYCCRSKSWTSYWSKTINIWIIMNKYDLLCNYTIINYFIFKITFFDFILFYLLKLAQKLLCYLYCNTILYCISVYIYSFYPPKSIKKLN